MEEKPAERLIRLGNRHGHSALVAETVPECLERGGGLEKAMVRTISVVGPVTTYDGWIGLVSIAVALFVGLLLWRAYCKTNDLQKELIQLTREQHDWLVRQRQPNLLTAAVYVTRYVDTPGVKQYPGHSGSSDPHTGFTTTLVLNNPGEATLHVLRLLVRLEGDPYVGNAWKLTLSPFSF